MPNDDVAPPAEPLTPEELDALDRMRAAIPRELAVRVGVCKHDHPDTSADVIGVAGEFYADCGCSGNAIVRAQLIAAAINALPRLLAMARRPAADAALSKENARLRAALRDIETKAMIQRNPLIRDTARAHLAEKHSPERIPQEFEGFAEGLRAERDAIRLAEEERAEEAGECSHGYLFRDCPKGCQP